LPHLATKSLEAGRYQTGKLTSQTADAGGSTGDPVRCYQMTKPNESEQRDLVSQFFSDILIAELQKRDYVVLAKQQHAVLVDNAEAVLERTDIPR
jgi:hypothetical protein